MALLNNPKNNKKPSAKDIKIDDDATCHRDVQCPPTV